MSIKHASCDVTLVAGVVRFALAVCVALYAAVGFFGYAAFREHTSGRATWFDLAQSS